MFRSSILRQTARAARSSQPSIASRSLPSISATAKRCISQTTPALQEKTSEGEESHSQTDPSIKVTYEEHELPSSKPVQGRGGMHFKRTLATFSLEGKVGIVTGGARGLGLVMSQAMVISGADVAIVDLNSELCHS